MSNRQNAAFNCLKSFNHLFPAVLLVLIFCFTGAKAAAQDKVPFAATETLDEIRAKIALNGYSFTVDHNWVYDLSPEEKARMFPARSAPAPGNRFPTPNTDILLNQSISSLPSKLDWRNYNGHSYIGPVRNQGESSACVTFGCTDAASLAYNVKYGLYDENCAAFSVMYFLWTLGTTQQYDTFGYMGGDAEYNQFYALMKTGGIKGACGFEGAISEALFPFVDSKESPPQEKIEESKTYPRVTFKNWGRAMPANYLDTTEQIKAAIATYGSVAVQVDHCDAFNAYKFGIYEDSNTLPDKVPYYDSHTGHGVSLVGWDDNPPEGGGGCWILRNEWGPGWGENGYMRIRYFSAKVNVAAAYPVAGEAAGNYAIRGTVAGPANQGITISLTGSDTGAIVVGKNSKYALGNLAAGTYTVTPSYPGYSFNPSSSTVTLPFENGDFTECDFTSIMTGPVLLLGVSPDNKGITYPPIGQAPVQKGQWTFIYAKPADVCYAFKEWQIVGDAELKYDKSFAVNEIRLSSNSSATAVYEYKGEPATVNLTMSPGTSAHTGTTIPAFGINPVAYNNPVNITAIPAEGYFFSSWCIEPETESHATIKELYHAETTIMLTGDALIRAYFYPVTKEVNLTMTTLPTGAGFTIPLSGITTVVPGESMIEIEAIPADGYYFDNWQTQCPTFKNAHSSKTWFIIHNNMEVKANFKRIESTATLTLAVPSGQHGTTEPAPGPCTVAVGEHKEIKAVPDPGHIFVNWSGTGMADIEDPYSDTTLATLSGDATVTANFAPIVNTATLTIAVDPVFTESFTNPGAADHVVPVGAWTDIEAVPGAGYFFGGWTIVGNADVRNPLSKKTSVMISANAAVTANFKPIDTTATLTIAVSPDGSGFTNPSDAKTVPVGEHVEIEAVPADGYFFVEWTAPGSVAITDAYAMKTFAVLSGDATVTANFAQILPSSYKVAFKSDLNGRVSGRTIQYVSPGASSEAVTAIPDENCKFVNWTSGAMTTTLNPLKVTNVTSDRTFHANFAITSYLLNYAAGSHGSISGPNPQTVNHGGNGEAVTAVPAKHYQFVSWSDGYPMPVRRDMNVTSNVSVTANFAPATAVLTMSKDGGAAVSPASGTVNTNEDIAISATALPGLPFVNWAVSGAASVADANSANTTAALTSKGTVTAIFRKPIANGVPISRISGAAGIRREYKLAVPAGQVLLEVKTCGGTGNCELTVEKDGTILKYGAGTTNNETLQVENPPAGDYIIILSSKTGYAGLKLTAKFYKAKPLPPASVAATKGAYPAVILVSWKASAGAVSYLVYRSETPVIPAESLAETSDSTYMDPKDAVDDSGKIFNYWVKASNSAGVSAPSAMASGNVSSAPKAPRTVTVSNGLYFDRIEVSWPKVIGATSYSVYRNTANDFNTAALIGNVPYDNTKTAYTYNDMGNAVAPTRDQTYRYWVRAVNANGSSSAKISSASGSVRRAGPATIAASQGTLAGKIRITWAGVPGATNYELSDGTGATTVNSLTYDYAVNDTVSHSFRVRANLTVNEEAAYQSDFSRTCSGKAYMNNITALRAPLIRAVSKGEGPYVRTAWGEVPLAARYNVYRKINTADTWALLSDTPDLSYRDDSAVKGQRYLYCVEAVNGTVRSAKSAAVSGYAAGELAAPPIESDSWNSGIISGEAGDQKVYRVNVPAGVTRLVAEVVGGTGTCDLYAKLGCYPTATLYNAKGAAINGTTALTVANPAEGAWYVLVCGTGPDGYSDATLYIDCYTLTDIVFTQVPADDRTVPFNAAFRGRVLDRSGAGVAGINLQVRNPITGLASWLATIMEHGGLTYARTDANGCFTYSATVKGEGEYTYDFFFTDIPDYTRSIGSWTIKTKKSPGGVFDFSTYLSATQTSLSSTSSPSLAAMQQYMNVRRGFASGPVDADSEVFWVERTIGTVKSDANINSKLDSGLYFLLYGTEGAAVGNGMTANPGLTASPLLARITSDETVTTLETILFNLQQNGLVDAAFVSSVAGGGIGVVVLTAVNNPYEEPVTGGYGISLYADQQLELLANLAVNAAGKVTVVKSQDKTYGGILTSLVNIEIDGVTRTIGVRAGSFTYGNP